MIDQTIILFVVCELCQSVRANRAARFVPEGGRIQMSCEVVHCGFGWNGGWVFQDIQSTSFTLLSPSIRIQLSNNSLTVNRTVLVVHIQNINQSDAGAYKCQISWVENLSSSGHVTYVNVTAGRFLSLNAVYTYNLHVGLRHIIQIHFVFMVCIASGGSSERSLSHRLMVCLGALTGFPLVLGLLWCLTKCHPSTPTVPPHPHTSCKNHLFTQHCGRLVTLA